MAVITSNYTKCRMCALGINTVEMKFRETLTITKFARGFFYIGCITGALLTARPLLNVTVADYFFGASLLFGLIIFFSKLEKRYPHLPHLLALGVSAYAIGSIVSLINSNDISESLGVLVRVVYVTVVWLWLASTVLKTYSHISIAAVLWIGSVLITSVAALVQVRWPTAIPGSTPIVGRMTGFTGHPNDLGAICATALSLVVGLWMTIKRNLLMDFLASSVFFITFSALILSGSVGSLLAAMVGLGLWALQGIRAARKILLLAVVALIGIGYLVATDNLHIHTSYQRIFVVFEKSDPQGGTVNTRIQTYKIALNRIFENPLVGVGARQGGSLTSDGWAVHNYLLGAWYEAGIFGFIGLGIISLSILRMGYVCVQYARTQRERYLARGLVFAIISFLIYSLGAPGLYQRYGWIYAALLFALRVSQKKEHLSYANRIEGPVGIVDRV